MADQLDKFGLKMIYPTRQGGREYFIRETVEDLKNDSRQGGDFRDDISGGNNTDGFTVGDNGQVRLHVGADSSLRDASNPDLNQEVAKGRGYAFGTKDWDMRGIEMTTQFKCTKLEDSESTFIMKGPSGSHRSNTVDCSGSSYLLRFYVPDSGSHASRFEWAKEQWHVHYVTKPHQATNLPHLFNKWCTGKYIIYLIKSTDGTQQWVKLEAWLDVPGDGVSLKKVGEIVDKGGWSSGDGALECKADRKDEIITWDNAHMTLRWNGPVFRFRNFSIREVDPTKTIGSGEPIPPPTTGTVFREWIFRNNIITFPLDACNTGQDTTGLKKFYEVGGGSASNLHKERYRVGMVANGSNSAVIGHAPKRVVASLSKTGTLPVGEVTCVMRRANDDEVVVTFAHVGGPLQANALTTSPVNHTFENLTSNYTWANGDRLMIEYSGNTVDVTNEVNVFRDTDNPFDGGFTCAIKFDAGGIPPTTYTSPDLTRDYAWEIWE